MYCKNPKVIKALIIQEFVMICDKISRDAPDELDGALDALFWIALQPADDVVVNLSSIVDELECEERFNSAVFNDNDLIDRVIRANAGGNCDSGRDCNG